MTLSWAKGQEDREIMNLGGTVRFNKQAVVVLLLGFTGLYILYSLSGKRSSSSSSEPTTNEVTAAKVSVAELLCAAIAVAEAGGTEVKAVRESGGELKEKSKGKTKEGVKDVATDGDMKSHRVMFGTLTAAFPKVKVISEEHDDAGVFPDKLVKLDSNCPAVKHNFKKEWVPSSAVTIWIDPLDATKEYTENLLEYVTTMVCVAVNGKPVIGVIHKPFEGKTYWGWVDHDVSKELHAQDNKSATDADGDSFIISRSHTGDKVEKLITSKFPSAKIKTAGGAGFKSLEVAGRRQGAYVHTTYIKKWDVCAGHAVISALGGRVTTLKGEDITYGPSDPSVLKDGLLATLNDSDFYSKLLSKDSTA